MSSPLGRAVRDFTRSVTDPDDVAELLDGLVDHVVAVHGAHGAAITLRDASGDLRFATASTEPVRRLELVKERIEEGPCYDAFHHVTLVEVPDLAAEVRWPSYRERAVEVGIRSAMSVPMEAGGRAIGVLNVYRTGPGPWTAEDRDAAEILAAMGAAYLALSTRLRESLDLSSQLQHALDARVIIEQAKGYLMASRGISATQAHATMRTHARSTSRKLAAVAADVLSGAADL